ncbi:MAG: RNA polymerase Rpb4 family protein [Candidatus Micrarchaeota archaeon]
MKVVSQKPVLFPEALELLEERKKGGELGYEQQNTLQYLQSFSSLSAKQARALFKELVEAGLTEKQAALVCNLLPKREDLLKAVLTADKSDVSDERVKEVLKIVKKY